MLAVVKVSDSTRVLGGAAADAAEMLKENVFVVIFCC